MSEGNLDSTKRFVPSGVDAQSWIGFEHRIQERRFNALVEGIASAVARHDGVAARLALEEARELRPGAPELDAWSARVALLPVTIPSAASSAYAWYRGLGAVAMFAVGIGLVIGIEHLRPETGEQAPVAAITQVPEARAASATPTLDPVVTRPAVASGTAAEVPADSSPTAPERTASIATPPVTTVRIPVEPTETRTANAAISRPAGPPERTREEPVGTAGASSASNADVRRADVPNRSTFRPPVETAVAGTSGRDSGRAPEPVLQTSREVPDDDVAASARSDSRSGFTETPSPSPAVAANPGSGIAASVAPQPVSILAPPVLPATAAGSTNSMSVPRGDDTRVAQVLNQYARAYDRLDSTAARAVWPTVDERALTRAFASLESQDVSFDRCDIDVKGNQASASCRGTASYVGKIGSRQARTEARQWNFELKLHGDDWKIEKAQASAR